ncbi:MAG: hypothetical protein ACFFDN_27950 [Candidatus Hodarchaeota archaeon]
MDDVIATNIFRWFKSLEDQLVEFLDIVPAHVQNMGVWSPRLATIIIESCGLIDSVFRHLSPKTLKIKRKTKTRDELGLSDYAELYKNLMLHKRKVIFLTRPSEYRVPFDNWHDSSSMAPEWWSIHNKLKHNRLKNISNAKLENAINALAGSLLVITSIPELGPYLISQKWFNLRGFNPEIAVEFAQSGFNCSESFTVETSIFVVVLGQKNFSLPDSIEDFRPVLFGGSPRLMAFFRKF